MLQKRFHKLLSGVLVTAMIITLLPEYLVAEERMSDGVSITDSSVQEASLPEDTTDKKILYNIDTKDAAYLTEEKAAAATGVVRGKCGENVNYEIDLSTGHVVISGSGSMTDYTYLTDSPFYSYWDKIKTVTINEGVTSVGETAFAFCFDLERVALPNTVTSIGQWAFLGCVSLEILKIPEQVKSIGNYSLGYYCSNGKEGTYYKKAMTILGKSGSAAQTYATQNGFTFADQDALTGTCGENVIWTFDSDTGVLTISGDGTMGDYDYYNNRSPYYIYRFGITSVVVEPGVTGIGQYAFNGLVKLEEVTISDSVIQIGYAAFRDCTALQAINLPEQLTTIGAAAFYNCFSLKNIMIPEPVSLIGGDAFYGCMQLEQIEVEEGNAKYASSQGILYDKTLHKLILVPINYPERVLVVPSTVSSFEHSAIYHCPALKYLIFEGDAPSVLNEYYLQLDDAVVYCDMSKNSWKNCLSSWKEGNGIWADLSDLRGQDVLSIVASSTTLTVGKSTQLSAVLDPSLAVDFLWDSSDESVAVVSNTGKVNAVGPGTVNIRVKSADDQYSADISLTVTGNAFFMPSYDLKTLEEELDYTNIYVVTKQIASEKLHGMYFLNGKELGLYSFVDRSYQTVKTFPDCRDAYTANDKLYVLYNDSSSSMNTCYVYDLLTQSVVSKIVIPGYELSAIGADDDGRIYVSGYEVNHSAKNKILLLSPEGELLSELTVGTSVYAFAGFDHTNGNFYMESAYDYYSWGYSHTGTGLTMGRVTNNTLKYIDTQYSFLESGIISRTMSCLLYLHQDYYMEHQTSAELLGGRYLTAVSAMHGSVNVFDSHSAGENGIREVLSLGRSAMEGDVAGSYTDVTSIGVRAVYNEARNSIIVYENDNNLSEYDLLTGDKIAAGKTAHRVFNMQKMGDSLLIIEKEDNSYYLEIFDWGEPEQIKIRAEKTTMKVGTTQTLTLESEKPYTILTKWSSSNKSVLTVTQGGKLSAWKEGSAVITAKMSETASSTVTVTVTASTTVTPVSNIITSSGAKSSNCSANDYSVYGNVVNSYLVNNSDQTLTRVEYIRDTGIQIETYSKDMKLQSSKVLPVELSYFGGFYAGKDANFLVFGQTNKAESNSTEVIRIVKYSKKWVRLGQTSVMGANTYIPFDAGSLRMAETSSGKLYIHTCHEMYAGSNGVHHQANMTFVVNEASMEMEQSYYDVMNIAQAGYVSHSFNQFVQTDDTYVFRVDHGDAKPRAISLTRCEVDGKITNVAYVLPLSIKTNGDNDTGVSVGGMELSSENCLIVGNSVDQTKKSTAGNRNIFLSVTNKSLTGTNMIWLTNYTAGSAVTARTPHIVKLNDEQFLITWEEYDSTTKKTTVKMVTVDGEGNLASEVVETNLRLSDCKPILTSDGLVKWYVTNQTSAVFCVVNPYKLSSVKGKIDSSLEPQLKDDDEEKDSSGSKENPVKIPAKKVKLNTQKIYMVKGNTVTIKATLTPLNTTDTLKVKSSKPKVAKVSIKKNIITIKAIKAGKATITITATSGKQVTCTVNVVNKAKAVKSKKITLNKKTLTIKKGESSDLLPKLTPANSTDTIKWSSKNKKIATVDAYGTVTGKNNGKTTITAKTSSGKKATCEVTVKTVKIPAKKVKLNTKKIYMVKGKTVTIKATVTPLNTTDTLKVKSSKPKVAKVSIKKNIITVKAIKAGKTTITITATSGKQVKCTVNVVNKAKAVKSKKITLNKKTLTIQKGESSDLLPKLTPANSTDTIKWSSKNKKIATVDAYGTVTGKNNGKTTITAKTSSGKKATCKVTVKKK